MAAGPGKLLENGERAPLEVAVGNVVVYSEYGGTEVTVEGTDYIILGEDSVLAVKSAKSGLRLSS